jgi:hypothetical protein
MTLVANADFIASGNFDFENGADAVVLIDALGTVVDAVGYGAISGTNPASTGPAAGQNFFEGTPTFDPFAPNCIARRFSGVDTDDNLADFDVAVPTPGVAQTNTIAIQASGINGGSFNSVSVSGGQGVGFETWASGAAFQIMLVAGTDPATQGPLPLNLPVFDPVTEFFLNTGYPAGIFNNFTVIAPTDGRVLGNTITFDLAPISTRDARRSVRLLLRPSCR